MSAPEMILRRAQQPAPTEAGWYYGRSKLATLTIGLEIKPRYVAGSVVKCGSQEMRASDFDWFGPVPVCVESGS